MKHTRRGITIISMVLCIVLLGTQIPLQVNADNETQISDVQTPFPVNYDPNDGMIQYGHAGEVGMRPENDINNEYPEDETVVCFPDDVINERDENGNLLFPDYDPNNPYYDYKQNEASDN